MTDDHQECSLQQYFELQYRPAKLNGARRVSVAMYRSAIRSLCRFLGTEPMVQDLNFTLVQSWYRGMRRTSHVLTAERRLRHLLAIWEHAHAAGLAGSPKLARFNVGCRAETSEPPANGDGDRQSIERLAQAAMEQIRRCWPMPVGEHCDRLRQALHSLQQIVALAKDPSAV